MSKDHELNPTFSLSNANCKRKRKKKLSNTKSQKEKKTSGNKKKKKSKLSKARRGRNHHVQFPSPFPLLFFLCFRPFISQTQTPIQPSLFLILLLFYLKNFINSVLLDYFFYSSKDSHFIYFPILTHRKKIFN